MKLQLEMLKNYSLNILEHIYNLMLNIYITIKPFLIMELKMVILFQNVVHPEEAQDSVYILLMLRKITQEL